MPADPSFDGQRPETAIKADKPYGCHNRPRPTFGQPVVSRDVSWPYRFSTECRYDRSETDSRCQGCQHAGSVTNWHKEK